MKFTKFVDDDDDDDDDDIHEINCKKSCGCDGNHDPNNTLHYGNTNTVSATIVT